MGERLPESDNQMMRLVLGVGLADDRRVDLARQPARGLGDAGLHVLERRVDVARELELDGDVGWPWREVEEICLTPSTDVIASSMRSTTSGLHDLGRGALVGHVRR